MSPVGRAGSRRAQLQFSYSCPHMGQAGLVLEGVGTVSLEVCRQERGDPFAHAVEELPALLAGC